MKEPLVTIIIINWNGLKHLKDCFDSLNNVNYENIEIIFVDNGSIDNSVEFVKNKYKNVKIIKLEKNYGFATPNNIAASQASGEYIVLLNNDVIVEKDWLNELVKVAKENKKIGIVASKIYFYDKPVIINYAGGSFEKFGYSRHIGAYLKDQEILNVQRETFFGCGASLLIKKKLYNEIGLFDDIYFAYCEDIDLCWRAWISGYKVIYAPKSVIYHKIGQTTKNQFQKRLFWNERNRLRTILKNYQITSLIKILPFYIKRRIINIKLWYRRNPESARIYLTVYLKSFLWNFYHLDSLIKNRIAIRLIRKKNDKYIFKLMDKTTKLQLYISKQLK